MELCLGDSSQSQNFSKIKPPLIPFPSMGPKYNWVRAKIFWDWVYYWKKWNGPRVFGLAKNSFLANRKTVHKYFFKHMIFLWICDNFHPNKQLQFDNVFNWNLELNLGMKFWILVHCVRWGLRIKYEAMWRKRDLPKTSEIQKKGWDLSVPRWICQKSRIRILCSSKSRPKST